jgi:hypothetical protein
MSFICTWEQVLLPGEKLYKIKVIDTRILDKGQQKGIILDYVHV